MEILNEIAIDRTVERLIDKSDVKICGIVDLLCCAGMKVAKF